VYARLCSWENLCLAHRRAAKGKRGTPAAARFEHRLEDNLLALQAELSGRTYRPGAYHSFTIHEPKRRLISAAPFRDRVVHHALSNVTEPVFERTFVADTYANRACKGTHAALDRAQRLARRFRYVLQGDVEQFFPSIDHAILEALIARKLRDPGVRWLVARILESGRGVLGDAYRMTYFPGDDLFAPLRPRGLPIGNLTSQLWANVYLSPLDHFVLREMRGAGYVRYVDDFVLFGDDKRALLDARDAVVERLARLRLTIHPGAHARPVTEGFPFLGFVVSPDRRRVKRRKVVHFRRTLAKALARIEAGEARPDDVLAQVRGWVSHVRYGNTVGLRDAVLRDVVLRFARSQVATTK
jgi:retron-type reverse transcriptase